MKNKHPMGNKGAKPVGVGQVAKPSKMGKSHMNTPGVKKAAC